MFTKISKVSLFERTFVNQKNVDIIERSKCIFFARNVRYFQPRDAASKLKAGSSIEIDGVPVAVDATLVEEAAILSNIFSINDSHAVELLLSGNFTNYFPQGK